MAKKIKIDNKLLAASINHNGFNKKNNNIILIIIIGVLVASLVGGFIYFNSKLSNSKRELDKLENEYSDIHYKLFSITGFNTVDYIKEKIDFYDRHIVFQITGYGNYYYTYDCFIKKVDGKKYSAIAYNEEAAKANGLKKGSC